MVAMLPRNVVPFERLQRLWRDLRFWWVRLRDLDDLPILVKGRDAFPLGLCCHVDQRHVFFGSREQISCVAGITVLVLVNKPKVFHVPELELSGAVKTVCGAVLSKGVFVFGLVERGSPHFESPMGMIFGVMSSVKILTAEVFEGLAHVKHVLALNRARSVRAERIFGPNLSVVRLVGLGLDLGQVALGVPVLILGSAVDA